MNIAQRQRICDIGHFLRAHEPLVDYPTHDVRGPLDAATWALSGTQMKARLAGGKHLTMDCSQGIACVYKWAGMKNPSGNIGWPGTTGTMLQARPHYTDPTRARKAAIVIFGPGAGDHGCFVIGDEGKSDPWLWSHGFNGGPILVRLSVERRFHRPPVTFLNVSGIGPA